MLLRSSCSACPSQA